MAIAGGLGPDSRQAGFDRVFAALQTGGAVRPKLWRGDGVALAGFAPSRARWAKADDGLCVLIDGSLHYLDDWRTALGLSPAVGDADVLAAGYRRWGLAMFERLAGEFAIALWDGVARRLMLARDPMALWPLFYWQGGGRFLFASSTRALQADPEVPRQLDLDQVADSLFRTAGDHAETIFREISRVRAGHVAVFEGGRCRQHRWWRPEEQPPIRFSSDQAYADSLRDVLDRAVGERLPASGPVAVTLSGGLDSTSVAVLAARRLARQGRRLLAVTLVPAVEISPDATGYCFFDERAGAGLVAASCPNIEHHLVAHDVETDLFLAAERRNRYSDFPVMTPFNIANSDRMMEEIQRHGCPVALGGGLGNFSVSYDGLSYLPATLGRGRLLHWAGLWPGLLRSGLSWRAVLNASFGPLMSTNWRQKLVRAAGGDCPLFDEISPLRQEFAMGAGLAEKNHHFFPSGDSRLARLWLLQRHDRGPGMEYITRRFGVVSTDPTSDRRVVEFCLSIPEEQFILGGQTRSLIRRAMAGLLPDPVRLETRRGRQAGDWGQALTNALPQIHDELARMEKSDLAQQCLDLKRLRALVEHWPRGGWRKREVELAYSRVLARGLSLGGFLRRFEGGNG